MTADKKTEATILPSICDPDALMRMCRLAETMPEGSFVEVGVFGGGSGQRLYEVAERQSRLLYLYDTFAGIPYKDDVDSHAVGDFCNRNFEAIADALPNAIVTIGVFPQSAQSMRLPIAFVHLDVDQYRSYKESVEYLEPLMASGGVMWFDDYGCTRGATKYLDEKFGKAMQSDGKFYMRF